MPWFHKADRAMAWINFKRSWPRMTSGTDWRNGRLSGFPDCCNVWFHIRIVSMFSWIRLFGNYGYFHDPSPLEIRQGVCRSIQHVCCPLHKFLYRKGRGFVYLYCQDCKNMQLNSHTCYKCGGAMVKGSDKVLAQIGQVR